MIVVLPGKERKPLAVPNAVAAAMMAVAAVKINVYSGSPELIMPWEIHLLAASKAVMLNGEFIQSVPGRVGESS